MPARARQHSSRRVAKIALVVLAVVAVAPIYFWPVLPVFAIAVPLLVIVAPAVLALRDQRSSDPVMDRPPEDAGEAPAYSWTPKPIRRALRTLPPEPATPSQTLPAPAPPASGDSEPPSPPAD